MPYRLLDRFERLFNDGVYNHRISTHGDMVALELYEDLLDLDKSHLLAERIHEQSHVVNTRNRTAGKKTPRRGDGTFGELVPSEQAFAVQGYRVRRGATATLEIGVECKIINVAQGRQVDRVVNDLRGQVASFTSDGPNAVSVAVVGVNRAERYRSVEGAKKPRNEWRETLTTGKGSTLHPHQEADKTIQTLNDRVKNDFTEFLILEFEATNEDDHGFRWCDTRKTESLYSAALTRIARSYAQRFRY